MVSFLPCSQPSDPNRDPDHPISAVHSSPSSSPSIVTQSSLQSVPSLSLTSDQSAAVRHHCSATLHGHSSYIFSLAIAGKHLYTGSSDGDLRSWDRNPNSSSNSILSGNLSAVKSIAVLGDKLFTGHNDRKIRVWKIESTPLEAAVAAGQLRQKPVAILPTMTDRWSRFFSTSNYVKIRRHKKCTWVHHVDAVSAIAVDTSSLYSASWDRSLKIWRTSDFKCVQSIQNAHDDAINAVVVSVDGTVYTGSADTKIKSWRRNPKPNNDKDCNFILIGTMEKHKSGVNALALSEDGSILYSGACDRSIVVWENMKVVGALRGHKKAILCLTVVGEMLWSGSADGTVRMWRREMGRYECLGVLEGHESPVKCLTARVDEEEEGGYVVYSGSLDKVIKVWKVWVPESPELGCFLPAA